MIPGSAIGYIPGGGQALHGFGFLSCVGWASRPLYTLVSATIENGDPLRRFLLVVERTVEYCSTNLRAKIVLSIRAKVGRHVVAECGVSHGGGRFSQAGAGNLFSVLRLVS